jgi:hypothetical protein
MLYLDFVVYNLIGTRDAEMHHPRGPRLSMFAGGYGHVFTIKYIYVLTRTSPVRCTSAPGSTGLTLGMYALCTVVIACRRYAAGDVLVGMTTFCPCYMLEMSLYKHAHNTSKRTSPATSASVPGATGLPLSVNALCTILIPRRTSRRLTAPSDIIAGAPSSTPSSR